MSDLAYPGEDLAYPGEAGVVQLVRRHPVEGHLNEIGSGRTALNPAATTTNVRKDP